MRDHSAITCSRILPATWPQVMKSKKRKYVKMHRNCCCVCIMVTPVFFTGCREEIKKYFSIHFVRELHLIHYFGRCRMKEASKPKREWNRPLISTHKTSFTRLRKIQFSIRFEFISVRFPRFSSLNIYVITDANLITIIHNFIITSTSRQKCHNTFHCIAWISG